jgi:hypothetical protein
VNWARELAVVGVKYRLFAGVLEDLVTPADGQRPT